MNKQVYEIKNEPVTPGYTDADGNFIKTGKKINKYNIYYYGGEYDGLKEFFGYSEGEPAEGVQIRTGYIKKQN